MKAYIAGYVLGVLLVIGSCVALHRDRETVRDRLHDHFEEGYRSIEKNPVSPW